MDGLLHFTSVPVSFPLKDLDIGHGYRVPCPKALLTYSCGVVQFTVFFEPDTQEAFGFPNVGVRRVLVTCNVVDGATLLFLGFLSLGWTILDRRELAGLWYMWMPYRWYILPSCSDRPAT